MTYDGGKLINLQSLKDVAERIQVEYIAAIAKAGYTMLQTADSIPLPESAEENVLYLVLNSAADTYDIYTKIGKKVIWLNDYTTMDSIRLLLENYVQKEAGKGLSANDYTDEEKLKLNNLSEAASSDIDALFSS